MTRRGFTLIEMAITLSVIALLAAMVIRGAGRSIQRSKVDRAASILAADMEQAFSIAGRLRRPVQVTFNTTDRTYQVADVNGATVRLSRSLGRGNNDYNVTSMATDFVPSGGGTATTFMILPPGRANGTLTITLRNGDRQRQVSVSTAGYVRVTS